MKPVHSLTAQRFLFFSAPDVSRPLSRTNSIPRLVKAVVRLFQHSVRKRPTEKESHTLPENDRPPRIPVRLPFGSSTNIFNFAALRLYNATPLRRAVEFRLSLVGNGTRLRSVYISQSDRTRLQVKHSYRVLWKLLWN